MCRCDECLEILINTNRLPEAAFFARTYLPSQVSRSVACHPDGCSCHPHLCHSVGHVKCGHCRHSGWVFVCLVGGGGGGGGGGAVFFVLFFWGVACWLVLFLYVFFGVGVGASLVWLLSQVQQIITSRFTGILFPKGTGWDLFRCQLMLHLKKKKKKLYSHIPACWTWKRTIHTILYPVTSVLPFCCHRVVSLWKKSLSSVNKKSADSLADPTEYENLFPGLRDTFKAEQFAATKNTGLLPASAFPSVPVSRIILILFAFKHGTLPLPVYTFPTMPV